MVAGFEVYEGDYVEISLQFDPRQRSKGSVSQVKESTNPDEISVVLTNGDFGTVIRVINSIHAIEERVMTEGQHTENKEKFGEDVMKSDVIPKTVQSFLNSGGGYLYVGIRDTGTIEERLAGLDYDFDMIRAKHGDASNDKLCDILEKQLMDALSKHLRSRTSLGPLMSVDFPTVRGIQIMQVKIKKSPLPWFFKNLTRSNKEEQFQIQSGGKTTDQRRMDDFYIREGNSKKRLETHQEFYEYAKDHFKNV